MRFLLIAICIYLFIPQLHTQELAPDSDIYLLTCSPGNELYNTFGHTAIRVHDKTNGKDVVFNYGIFDFKTKNFYSKFLRGKLPYKLAVQRMSGFLSNYESEKRSVYQQHLDLTPEQKSKAISLLLENYKPENREYKYDFFFDNCSTRPRDIFEALGGLQYGDYDAKKTFRNQLDEYLGHMPWADFGIDLIIGSIADRKADQREQMFLPDYLHDAFTGAHLDGKTMVPKEDLALDYIAYNADRKSKKGFGPIYLFGILLLLELIMFSKFWKNGSYRIYNYYNKLWLFLIGLAGVVICFMWFGTDHISTKNNFNLLWLNPLYLFVPFFKDRSKRIIIIFLILLSLIALIFSVFDICQNFHFAFIPIMIITMIKLFTQLSWAKGKL